MHEWMKWGVIFTLLFGVGFLRMSVWIRAQVPVQSPVTAMVVDVRPNGTLVLEAHKTIRASGQLWEYALTGIVRRDDVSPANTVLSEKIADLQIYKDERGKVRDSTKRGWFLRVWDVLAPV